MGQASKVCIGLVACAGLAMLVAAGFKPEQQPGGAAAAPAPVTGPTAETGYSIGFDLGREVAANLKNDGVNADLDAVVRGFGDAVRGAKPALTEAQITKLLAEVQAGVDEQRIKQKMDSDPAFKAAAADAASRSKAFMDKFGQRTGVQTLPGGIFYTVVNTGSGDAVGDAPAVVVNYSAVLTNRESIADKKGVKVALADLLQGPQAVLRKMRVGDRWTVAIPPEQAFGVRGHLPNIGPNEALLIDVEVLEVKK